jgi:hypothetical protein
MLGGMYVVLYIYTYMHAGTYHETEYILDVMRIYTVHSNCILCGLHCT